MDGIGEERVLACAGSEHSEGKLVCMMRMGSYRLACKSGRKEDSARARTSVVWVRQSWKSRQAATLELGKSTCVTDAAKCVTLPSSANLRQLFMSHKHIVSTCSCIHSLAEVDELARTNDAPKDWIRQRAQHWHVRQHGTCVSMARVQPLPAYR